MSNYSTSSRTGRSFARQPYPDVTGQDFAEAAPSKLALWGEGGKTGRCGHCNGVNDANT